MKNYIFTRKENMENLNILTKDKYKPTTITFVSSLNNSINKDVINEFIPVNHLFHNGERIKLQNNIGYFGKENVVINISNKKFARGVRTAAMKNMISLDFQFNGKNNHSKISDSKITIVGAKSFEEATSATDAILELFRNVKRNMEYAKTVPESIRRRTLEFFINEICKDMIICEGFMRIVYYNESEYDFSKVDKKLIDIFLLYIEDFEIEENERLTSPFKVNISKCNYELEALYKKLQRFLEFPYLYEGELSVGNSYISNSVYHFNILKDKSKLPIHKIAPYLANKGFDIDFNNSISDGMKICFDINEDTSCRKEKNYKHRFHISQNGSCRLISPTMKDESYGYYIGTLKYIQKFYEENDINYLDYVIVNE